MPGKGRTWLFYGINGTGKTTVAGTFPKPILVIDVNDEGDESLEDVDDVRVFRPSTYEELESAFWWLEANPQEYKTVVIDTLTQVQDLVVKEVAAKSPKKKKGKKPGAWGSMSQQMWGQASDMMKTLIMQFRSLPIDVVFLAQQKTIEVEDLGDDVEDVIMPEVGPAVMKSVALMACSVASFIGQTFIRIATVKKGLQKVRTPKYCIRVGPSPVYITKVRKGKSVRVPDYVSDPDFMKLTNIRKGLAADGTERKESKKIKKDVRNSKLSRR
jgi:hypothetical protein